MKFKYALIIGCLSLINICVISQVQPTDLEFRRHAVRRMIFDRSQNIPLSGLTPSKIVGIDVMHPAVGNQLNNPKLNIVNGLLEISVEQPSTSTRWVGAFNPFATYDRF